MGTLKKPRRTSGLRTTVVVGLGVGLIGVIALVAVGAALLNPFRTETVDRSGATVVERIRDLEEFTAAEAQFVQDVDLEADAKYLPDAIKGERVVAIAAGSVRATVDLGSLDQDAVSVSDDSSSISLVLPSPVLQSADIEEDETRVVSRQRGLVDRLADLVSSNPYDDGELYSAAERKLDAAAAESDLEETARANTQDWLETFLGAAGFDDVVVTWSSNPV
jgi:hypothetical protein